MIKIKMEGGRLFFSQNGKGHMFSAILLEVTENLQEDSPLYGTKVDLFHTEIYSKNIDLTYEYIKKNKQQLIAESEIFVRESREESEKSSDKVGEL